MISVYGATGFIGSNFVKYTKNVTDLVSKVDPNPKYNRVLYCIGTTDNYNILTQPTLDIDVNLNLLIRNLEILRKKFGTFEFNFLSSWFVYGDGHSPPFREDGNCNPKGFYSIAKLSAEMFLKSYCETFGIKYRILRLANVFGGTDKGVSAKKNALQFLLSQIKLGKDISLYEGGNFYRDYIDVRDVVSAIDCVLEVDGCNEVINIGSGKKTEFKKLIGIAIEAHNSESRVMSIPTPDFHRIVQVQNSWLDTKKLQAFGFKISHPISEEVANL
jgi:UDP-glucose 4-epimerase